MPKQITETTDIVIDLYEDIEIAAFLNHQKKSTRNTYTTIFRRVKEFTSESGKEILADPKLWKRKIFELHQWLIERGYSECYAQSATGMIRGFFAFNDIPLMFSHADSKRLAERNRSTEDYQFDCDDMAKMAMVGNLRERYVLLVGKSIGLRAGDFVNLTYGKFRGLKLDRDAPIFVGETVTLKEHVKAFPFLDSDAVPIIRAILDANVDKPNNEFILMTQSKKNHNNFQRMRDEELSIILQSLARKAKIQNGSKRVRFHCLRKYLCDRISAVMSESKWKQIIGKKINEGAYVSPQELREAFLRAMPTTTVTNGMGKVKKELEDTKTTVETLTQTVAAQAQRIEELEDKFEAKLAEKIKEVIKAINEFQK